MTTMDRKRTQFLMWYDDNPKIPTHEKIEEALEAFVKSKRWRERPNLVLVNEADVVDYEDITVRPVPHIRRNTFWVGYEDASALD